jgi:branched-subunit amino acid transport protein
VSAAWVTVVALFVATAAMKASGPLSVGGRRLPPRLAGVVSLIAPALLAALVINETINSGSSGITLDARLVGLASAALALVLRAPLLVVVAISAVATGVLRAVT